MIPNRTTSDYVPSLIFIETTKACEYTCRHCRAESQTTPAPDQLTLREIKDLLDQIKELSQSPPEVVLTGGDLLLRKDIKDVIAYTHELNLPFSISPAASPLLDDEFIDFIIDNRVNAVSLSIDGTEDGTHDWLRRIPGSFNLTLNLLMRMKKRGVNVQVNTTVMRRNVNELPVLASLVKDIGLSAWEVFFLIKTGRGIRLLDITPEQYMQINHWLSDLSDYGLNVRTVEGPLKRVIPQIKEISPDILSGELYSKLSKETRLSKNTVKESGTIARSTGNPHHYFRGTLFIGQNGIVYPSGLFTYSLGNIRKEKLKAIISKHTDLLDPRHSGLIKGKCGSCEFLESCGGSRARAFAYTGDPFAEDPACLYIPVKYNSEVEQRQH